MTAVEFADDEDQMCNFMYPQISIGSCRAGDCVAWPWLGASMGGIGCELTRTAVLGQVFLHTSAGSSGGLQRRREAAS